jgi:hypothetical protein
MPLYTMLSLGAGALGLDPVMAGRVVSLGANTLTLIPIFLVAEWLTGSRSAARWSVGLYLISPVPARWALRVMTDSLFSLWWWCAIACLLAATPRLLRADETRGPCPYRMMALAFLFGALAALTRHAGWVLLPPTLLAFAVLLRRDPLHALRSGLTLVLWALPLIWLAVVGGFAGHSVHVEQRFTWLASVIMLEAYALDWPLILGWPIALFAVWGLFRPIGHGSRWWTFISMFALCALGILALQCLIGSYLFRYLLPLVGFGVILAGGAFARQVERRPRSLVPLALLMFGWLGIITGSSLIQQRAAWADFRLGAEAMGALSEESTLCFTNESYGAWPAGDTTKASWWSGRQVQPLALFRDGQGSLHQSTDFAAGSLILLSSAYGGTAVEGLFRELMGDANPIALNLIERETGQHISWNYDIEVLGQWQSSLVPLLPDLMNGPFHQNPLAIRLRRSEQTFTTILLRVRGKRPIP